MSEREQIPDDALKLLRNALPALKKGLRVEWMMDKDGNIKANTIQRKTLK